MAKYWGPLKTELFPDPAQDNSARIVHWCQAMAGWFGSDETAEDRECREISHAVHHRLFPDQPLHALRIPNVDRNAREAAEDYENLPATNLRFAANNYDCDGYTEPQRDDVPDDCECPNCWIVECDTSHLFYADSMWFEL
jgi:hypothetical protein